MSAKIKKTLNRKSRKNSIKAIKKQLCDKINECKTSKELDGWKRTFFFHQVLKDDHDWDYCYLLDLIEFKLKSMRQYFWTHDIVENEKEYGNICDKLINILNAGYNSNIILEKDLDTYVNTRNIHRFINPSELEFIMKFKEYYLPTIRVAKAKRLFWKYLEHKIEYLWD